MAVCGLKSDGEFAVGAGFLIEEDGGRFFMTCGHLGHYANPPAADWSLWTSHIRVFLRQDAYFEVPLFREQSGVRIPNFHYLEVVGGTHIADAIAFDINGPAFPTPTLFEGHRVSPPTTFQFAPGDAVYGYGYPGLREDRWPYSPPDMIEGRILGAVGAAIHCALPSQAGHSGGPVFTADGDLIGMVLGHNDGEAVVIPRPMLTGIVRFGRNGGKPD